jgi:hypothetical protein
MRATIVSITDRDRLFTHLYVPPPHFSHELILFLFRLITSAVCVIHYPPKSTGREVLLSLEFSDDIPVIEPHSKVVRAIRAESVTYVGSRITLFI